MYHKDFGLLKVKEKYENYFWVLPLPPPTCYHVISLRGPESRLWKFKLFDLEWKKIKENRWYMGCGNEFQVGQKPSFSVISKLIIFLFCLRREATVHLMFYDLCDSFSSSSCQALSALLKSNHGFTILQGYGRKRRDCGTKCFSGFFPLAKNIL